MKAGSQFFFVVGMTLLVPTASIGQSLEDQRRQVYPTAQPQSTSLKTLVLQAYWYAEDHNDKLPTDLKVIEGWMHLPNVTGTGCSFNNKLLGANLTQLRKLADNGNKGAGRTVLFYEGQNGQLNFQHNGFALVCFLAGGVSAITKEEETLLRWSGPTAQDTSQYNQLLSQDRLIKQKGKQLTEQQEKDHANQARLTQQRNKVIEQTSVAAIKQFSYYGRWKDMYNNPSLDLHRNGMAIYYPEQLKPKPQVWNFKNGELTLTVEQYLIRSREILKYHFIPRVGGSKFQVSVDHTLFIPTNSSTSKKWTDEALTLYREWSE